MTLLSVHLLILLIFINRYLAGLWLRRVRSAPFEDTVAGYEPTVTVAIPMFNEGEGIYRTIMSLLDLDYPAERLEVFVVDDCSTDDSLAWARRAAAERPNVRVLENPRNMGKRRSINRVVRASRAEIIVSVDSDVVVDRGALRSLVARFTSPQIAAVGGRVNVANPGVNWLTRMQTIKYHMSYEYLKTLERAFQSVMCLSGCLTAYRRSVLLELEPILEDRNVLGVPIKYGEDRFLTRQIVKAGYKTTCTLDAVCYTTVPERLGQYFSQQLRWRRSNTIDFFGGLTHAVRLHPLVAIHYLSLFALFLAYPVVVVDSMLHGSFLQLGVFHLVVLGSFGALYRLDTRGRPPEERVGGLSLLPMAALMPVTYLIYTPLALFTLDSGSWETRGHGAQPAGPGGKAKDKALREAPIAA